MCLTVEVVVVVVEELFNSRAVFDSLTVVKLTVVDAVVLVLFVEYGVIDVLVTVLETVDSVVDAIVVTDSVELIDANEQAAVFSVVDVLVVDLVAEVQSTALPANIFSIVFRSCNFSSCF